MNYGSEFYKLNIWILEFFFHFDNKGSSQFWRGLHKVKHLFKWGAVYKVGNGQYCSFWQDVWARDVPLKI